jgi:hypothetical protein
MPGDFIPRNHEAFHTKFSSFKTWMDANGATFGFSPGEVAAFGTRLTALTSKLSAKQSADTAARAANQDLETEEDACEGIWRPAAKRLQAHPNMTDTIRANAGITIPDRVRTDHPVGPEVPGVEIKLTTGGVFIHWGTNPTNETLNGKPIWAKGANVYLSINGGPQFMVAFDTASPYYYGITGPPIALTVQVAYRGTKENAEGTKSAPVTVSTGG